MARACALAILVALLGRRANAEGWSNIDEIRRASVVRGALGQLAAIAARRERPAGGGGESHPYPMPADAFPNSTDPQTGLYIGSDASKWTSGYLSGCYYRAYIMTGDERWAKLGAAELPGVLPTATETDNHKVSHIFDSSFGEALVAAAPGTPMEDYQKAIQTAAASLAERFNPKVGAIQSWKDKDTGPYEVIIDSTASLKIMWEAARMPGGRQEWADIAHTHVKTVAREIFRPDNSTYHVVRFNRDTGEVDLKRTHQGYANESTWSRGQAWGVVGFTHAYNMTQDPYLLERAQAASDYFLKRLEETSDDGVPLWDFDVPPEAEQPWKDSSAAAIAASGLLRLGMLTSSSRYWDAGVGLVSALADKYLGWEWPGQRVESLLRNGTFAAPMGHHSTGLSWGDWYFMDALSLLAGSSAANLTLLWE